MIPLSNLSDLQRRLNLVCRPLRNIHKRQGRTLSRNLGPTLPRLMLMSDDVRMPNPVEAAMSLSPGDGFILRHRDSKERKLLAETLRPMCQQKGVALIIAADPQLAMIVGADGIHIAEIDIPCSAKPLYWARGSGMITTAAVHNETALRRAVRAGVDGILISPVFSTKSHPGEAAIGMLRFTRMASASTLPVYALGGVNLSNINRLRHSGMVGLAGISGIAESN